MHRSMLSTFELQRSTHDIDYRKSSANSQYEIKELADCDANRIYVCRRIFQAIGRS